MRVEDSAHELRVRAYDLRALGVARGDVPDQLRKQPELAAQSGMGHVHASYISHGFVDDQVHCRSSAATR
jgi:hypothetical protein